MSGWPEHPAVHEVFTWVWLDGLGQAAGHPVTLDGVPEHAWDELAPPGIDAVWLMGVWERSDAGAAIARQHPAMRADAESALPGLVDDDIVGSAYCVRDYRVDPRLGGDRGLAAARARLAERGVRLVLDLVPNHVAPDHRWVSEHPEYFVLGTPDDIVQDPDAFVQVGDHVIARGRDPYFPAWPEVLQLDASHPGLRRAMADLVVGLTDRCDGLRCDMAMLLLDDVVARTWGDRISGDLDDDLAAGFWPQVIGAARAARPDFVFWAEAYWGLEPALLESGFDACYDKELYDRVVLGGSAPEIRSHLAASVTSGDRAVRFVENHDEPRAASLLARERHLAALVTTFTLPGVALLHEGEADGRRVHVPVTLGRRPTEQPDPALRAGVADLLGAVDAGVRTGEWQLAEVEGWPDNHSSEQLAAWTWTSMSSRHLVVVNLGDQPADGRVRLPWADLGPGTVGLVDLLTGVAYTRDGDELSSDGLYVARGGFGAHVFRLDEPSGEDQSNAP